MRKEGRLYSKKHLWVSLDGSKATIGITDFLQKKLGTIMFLNLPDVGDKLSVGEAFGDIESKKTVMDLEAPISGTVTRVNGNLLDRPDEINVKPYESWFVEIEMSFVPEDLEDEKAYQTHISRPWMQDHD